MNADMEQGKLAAEQRARMLIDRQLADAGWSVQDKRSLNLFASDGVACREVVMKAGHGRADYLLYVERKVVGVIEAKPEGTTLSGVEWQSAMYASGLPAEAHFTNGYDPHARAPRIFNFPKPATLAKIVRDAEADLENPTWRAKVRHLLPLDEAPLRPAQITAIKGIEQSLADQHFDRSLVQMATGAGKTFTAVTTAYRRLKYGGFRRLLFLVDCNNLAEQTIAEFQNYRTPGDGRRFTEIYNVDNLTSAGMLGSSDVVVSTIQRVYSVLRGREVTDQDDPNLDDFVPDAPVTVTYCSALPPEAFDLVIVDEAHRSIYGVWRGVLEYFDAHVIGLTATPGKQTFAFFRQNLVSETPIRSPSPTGSTSTSTGSASRSARAAATSRPARSCPRSTAAPVSSDWRRSRRTSSTPTSSSTAPSPPSLRSASSLRRSATGSSPRSSPAAPRPPRR